MARHDRSAEHLSTEHLSTAAEQARLGERVDAAELPPLLVALAAATGDERLIADHLRPVAAAVKATAPAHGGMSAAAQREARQLAISALSSLRNGSCAPPERPLVPVERLLTFLTGEANGDYRELLAHELAIPADLGRPTWSAADLAATDFTVAIIGAGLSGIAAAYRLAQAGVSFQIFEKNHDFGGTWLENDYPGCRLDTNNYVYSYSFAQKHDWRQQYSLRAELHGYFADVADRAGLRGRTRFGTHVQACTWDDDEGVWTLSVRGADGREEERTFNAVISAVGQLNQPSYPDIPGRDRFAGRSCHSARWPADLEVAGRRVAVIGTGASAYQIIPAIADEVGHLTVFQRNAPWMLPTPNYHFDISEHMAWLSAHVPQFHQWHRFWQFWSGAEGRLPLVEVDPDWPGFPTSVSAPNEELRRQLVALLEAQYPERPDLLAKVTPTYPPGAKRMLRDNGVWARALHRPNVDLVTDGITEITERGIRTADGREHAFDVIVYATGFRASDFLETIQVTGREGRDLHRQWGDEARAHLGVTIPHFPNLFCVFGPNTGLVVNGSTIFMVECTVHYILDALHTLMRGDHRAMELRPEVLENYVEHMNEANSRKAWGASEVSSWYKNRSGTVIANWPFSLLTYWELTRNVAVADFVFEDRPARAHT